MDLRPASVIGQKLLASTPLYPVGKLAEKLLSLDRLDALYGKARREGEEHFFFENVLKQLGICCDYREQELARIPESGPVVIVSNHPFGLVEAPILAFLLSKRRRDVRFLANSLLSDIEILRDYLIPVDPFGGRETMRPNFRGMRGAIEWLRAGGLLVVFPAGEVSSFRIPELRVSDPGWNQSIGRLIRIAGAQAVPVYFHGANSPGFHIAGFIHPRLRTALLPRELFDKSGRTIQVSIGTPVAAHTPSLSNREFADYLRMRAELLQAKRLERQPQSTKIRRFRPIAASAEKAAVTAEVKRLDPILESGSLHVYLAEAAEIPQTLDEIARLREISFRAAGEGTGDPRDTDRFDQWYRHLFVWDSARDEIVGAYRVGLADRILADRGHRGLYTTTLFKFDPKFLSSLGPALELGRSFIVPEYQKEYLPLLLLWKGICQFVVKNPQYRTLFGAVSISNDYGAISRALIIEFCKAHADSAHRAKVQPKQRFRTPFLPGCDRKLLGCAAHDVSELSGLVAELEPDGKGMPVLLRQYLNLGGTILEFNVDPKFSNAVDGLILVDLLRADRRILARYMGREGLRSFVGFHGADDVRV